MADPVFTVDEMMPILNRSGLSQVEPAKLLASYRESYLPEAHLPDSIAAFCDYLVRNRILTIWQCNKLRKRQYKGFFLDRFVLLDNIGADENCSYYLARELDSPRRYVRLAVRPPIGAKGHVEYRVAEVIE